MFGNVDIDITWNIDIVPALLVLVIIGAAGNNTDVKVSLPVHPHCNASVSQHFFEVFVTTLSFSFSDVFARRSPIGSQMTEGNCKAASMRVDLVAVRSMGKKERNNKKFKGKCCSHACAWWMSSHANNGLGNSAASKKILAHARGKRKCNSIACPLPDY